MATIPLMPTPAGHFRSVRVRRTAAGSYTAGAYTAGAVVEHFIVASIQPAKDRDLLRLEEGQRSEGAVMVFTNDDLRTIDESGTEKADRIVHDGFEWEVMKVDRFGEAGIGQTQALCTRAATPLAATIPAPIVAPILVAVLSADGADLSWNDVFAASYRIERGGPGSPSASDPANFRELCAGVTDTSFVDASHGRPGRYVYRVFAVTAAGLESVASNTQAVTIL